MPFEFAYSAGFAYGCALDLDSEALFSGAIDAMGLDAFEVPTLHVETCVMVAVEAIVGLYPDEAYYAARVGIDIERALRGHNGSSTRPADNEARRQRNGRMRLEEKQMRRRARKSMGEMSRESYERARLVGVLVTGG